MEEMIKEKATLEFRQVRFAEWAGDHLLAYYKVQQKYLVPSEIKIDEFVKERSEFNLVSKAMQLYDLGYVLWDKQLGKTYYVKTKEEWRFLPEIKSEDLKKL